MNEPQAPTSDQKTVPITGQFFSYQLPDEILMDIGVIPDTRPPPSRWRRLRYGLSSTLWTVQRRVSGAWDVLRGVKEAHDPRECEGY